MDFIVFLTVLIINADNYIFVLGIRCFQSTQTTFFKYLFKINAFPDLDKASQGFSP